MRESETRVREDTLGLIAIVLCIPACNEKEQEKVNGNNKSTDQKYMARNVNLKSISEKQIESKEIFAQTANENYDKRHTLRITCGFFALVQYY